MLSAFKNNLSIKSVPELSASLDELAKVPILISPNLSFAFQPAFNQFCSYRFWTFEREA